VTGNYVIPRDVADRFLCECLGQPSAGVALRRLCDDIGGRISGTEKGRQAEEWAAEAFRNVGLDRVRFETVDLSVWERGSLMAEVTGANGWPLVALAHGFAPAECDIQAAVVDAGFGLPEDYGRLGELTRDAIVLCDEGAPAGKRTPHRTEKLAWALAAGAVGFMMGGSAAGCLPRTGVCHRTGSPIPSIGISQEDTARLRRLLEDGVRPSVRVRMANRLSSGAGRNVLGDLPGAELRDEIVLAGAHLDSWDISQGATDNGLGCAIVLQAVAALAACGRTPRRAIRFALWTAEETGLHGSRHYAVTHADELDRVVAVMNFDMAGDPFGFWVPGHADGHPLLASLARDLAPLGMSGEIHAEPALHSDHQPFMLAGVPIVSLAARLPEGGGGHYYHSAGDTFEKVSLPALYRAAAVAAHTLWGLADVPERPFERMSECEVVAMIEKAGLTEAVEADERRSP